MTSPLSQRRHYWIGVAVGPGAWALNTQLDYAMVPFWCQHRTAVLVSIAAILALLSLFCGFLSWRAARINLAFEWTQAGGGMPRSFMAWLGAGSGILFALVIADQLAASLLVSSCLR